MARLRGTGILDLSFDVGKRNFHHQGANRVLWSAVDGCLLFVDRG